MLRRNLALSLSAAAVLCLAAPCWSQEKPAAIYTKDNAPAAPKLDDLALKGSLSQYGMTWTFDKPARVGQFVNGDFYVVGAVTVTEISPKPLYGAEIPAAQLDHMDKEKPEKDRVHNGFMLNPPAAMKVSYDSGIRNWFDPSLIQKLPVAMKPGDSLVSTISMPMSPVAGVQGRPITRGEEDNSPVRDAAVLTCVAEPQPADAFRPAFCDRTQKIYLARNLKRELLPAVAPQGDFPKLEKYIRLTQRPWVHTCFFGFEIPNDDMPGYGQQVGECSGNCALLLCCKYTPQQKEPLLISFVQVGIDLGGMIRAGHPGWECWGGHGSGCKLPIFFAGLLLGDDELAHIHNSFPKAHFGEDEQTAYGDCWTGAKVVFTGHSGIDEATGIGRNYARTNDAWGPYEHIQPAKWVGGNWTSEAYRRANTSAAWIGQALAIHLLHAEKIWNHDAFLDYVDRWMFENDAPAVKTLAALGHNYDQDWTREGTCEWNHWHIAMWQKYRAGADMPPIDGWKQPHDDSYYTAAVAKELKHPR
ncbi:MAG: hypothetical protein ACLQVA_10820 [Candidatus Brocadiia bacterium]